MSASVQCGLLWPVMLLGANSATLSSAQLFASSAAVVSAAGLIRLSVLSVLLLFHNQTPPATIVMRVSSANTHAIFCSLIPKGYRTPLFCVNPPLFCLSLVSVSSTTLGLTSLDIVVRLP